MTGVTEVLRKTSHSMLQGRGCESIRPFAYAVESGTKPANSTQWDLACTDQPS